MPHSEDEAQALYERAEALFSQERFPEAVVAYSACLDRNPANFKARFNRAIARVLANDLAAASTDLLQVQLEEAVRADTCFVLGLIAERRAHRQEARICYHLVLWLDPTHTSARLRLRALHPRAIRRR